MKMSHKEYVVKQRLRAAEVASGMLNGSVHYLEGAIELSSLRFEVGLPEDDQDFLAFTGVSSEVDHWNGNTFPDIFFTQLPTTASHNLPVTDIRF